MLGSVRETGGFRFQTSVIKAPQPKTITGKIAAMPNPVPSEEESPVVIAWETNDPKGSEIRVTTSAGEEKLVTRGAKCGQVEIDWIADSTEYEFRPSTAQGFATFFDCGSDTVFM